MKYLTEQMLEPFQRRFLRAALSPNIDVAALSCARGQGKTCLSAYLLTRALTPGDPLFEPRAENFLAAASISQARATFRFVRAALEDSPRAREYRFIDNTQFIGATHKPSGARLVVRSRAGRTALGLVGVRFAVLDEPGAASLAEGQMMWEALETAVGKVHSPLRVILVGTEAPAVEDSWWPRLLRDPLPPRFHRTVIRGYSHPDKALTWPSLKRASPLSWKYPESRAVLLAQRDAAAADPLKMATFRSMRLNLPSRPITEVLFSEEQWEEISQRPPAGRSSNAVIGVDAGSSGWSAVVRVDIDTLLVECVAITPSAVPLERQEQVGAFPARVLVDLADLGLLIVDRGQYLSDGSGERPLNEVTTAATAAAVRAFGPARGVYSDFFRAPALRDADPALPWRTRRTQWSQSTQDISSLRKLALDEGMTIGPGSALLLNASLRQSRIESDTSGNVRLVRARSGHRDRNDVVAALILAAGAADRIRRAPAPAPELVIRQY